MLTAEEREFQAVVRQAARERLLDGATARAQAHEYPQALLQELRTIGLASMNIAEEYGGEKASLVAEGIAAEELARVDFNAAYWFLGTRRQAHLLQEGASETFKDRYLGAIARAEIWTSFALTEPSGGNDARRIKTRAVRNGDGWVLTGEKTSVSGAMLAPFVNVIARGVVDGEDSGFTAFVVPYDTPGVERIPFNDGVVLPSGRASVFFDGVRLTDEHLLGEVGGGLKMGLSTLQAARPIVGLMGLGVAGQTLDEAVAYAKEREAFGNPIGAYQGVSFRIADAAAEIEAARLVCYDALRHLDETGRDELRTSMAKLIATETAVRQIAKLMEIWGHYAYTRDFPLLQRHADVMSTLSWDGSSDIHRLSIARHLLGRDVVRI